MTDVKTLQKTISGPLADHYLQETTMSANAKNTVKVAAFRNAYDHLYRQANVHYHSCVGAREIRSWIEISKRLLAEYSEIQCSRASVYDKEQMERATTNLQATLERAEERAVAEETKLDQARQGAQATPNTMVQRKGPVLRLIQGGLN